MALALAFEDAKANQLRIEGDASEGTKGATTYTRFFDSPDNPDFPHAGLSQRDAGRGSCAHFHVNDQFQVVISGKGRLGRHDIAPYSIHFSRAYTPYGPLVSDAVMGLTFFVLRAHHDPGAQRLPKEMDRLKRVPDRRPWQTTRQATFPEFPSPTAGLDAMLQALPEMKDEQGLAAYTLSMKPNGKTSAPDPSYGDGQYLVVVKGSLWHDNKELKPPALVFVYPRDSPYQVHAGTGGMDALVLNFPSRQMRPTVAATGALVPDFKTWRCTLCAFVYNEAAGLAEEGIAPGTRWKDVPESWSCPDCSASKSDFQMREFIS